MKRDVRQFLVAAAVIAVPLSGGVLAQVLAPKPSAAKWVVPRTPDGKPDLQGNWSNETQTPLERQGNGPLILTDAEAQAIETRAQLVEEYRDQASDPNRTHPAQGRRSEVAGRAGPAVPHRADHRGRRRRRRRLQRLLACARHQGDQDRRRGAQLDHRRAGEWPHSAAHAGGPEARGRRHGCATAIRRIRSSRGAHAVGSLPDLVRVERRPADAAELLLQQQLHDRADEGPRRDFHGDGARRTHRPARRLVESAAADAILVRRLDRTLGRRHARDRDDQHPAGAARSERTVVGLPRGVAQPQGDRVDYPQRTGHAALQIPRRGSDQPDGAVHRRAAVQPARRAAVRIRVPRRQPCDDEYPGRCAPCRARTARRSSGRRAAS